MSTLETLIDAADIPVSVSGENINGYLHRIMLVGAYLGAAHAIGHTPPAVVLVQPAPPEPPTPPAPMDSGDPDSVPQEAEPVRPYVLLPDEDDEDDISGLPAEPADEFAEPHYGPGGP